MKCIYCDTDNDYKTRVAGPYKCAKCERRLAFEPTTDPLRVTDKFFSGVLRDVSGKGTLHFTERQLWYEFERHVRRRTNLIPSLFGFIVLALLLVVLAAAGLVFFALVAGMFALALVVYVVLQVVRRLTTRETRSDYASFRSRYLTRWEQAHGAIPGLLSIRPYAPLVETGREPDLTAYSFDRVVVTDKPEIAMMLVANNFHFENNCAILSENYPPEMSETLRGMLRRNPSLSVFAVHNASPSGCELPIALRRQDWFPDESMNVYDTGLRPRQAQALKLPPMHGGLRAVSNELRTTLKPDEVKTLEDGAYFELEALRPAKLIRTLYKYLNQARKPESRMEWGVAGLAPIFFIELGGEGGGADGDAGDGGDSFG